MKNNDDLLSVQGTIYTLVDSEGYLVREDINGLRSRYPISLANPISGGIGIEVNDNVISIDQLIVATKTNTHNVLSSSTISDYQFQLLYDPKYDIFLNLVTLSSNILLILPIAFTNYQLSADQIATFENWITTTNQLNIQTLSIDLNITIVGLLPDNLSGTLTHIFVRRIYKDLSGNVHQALSYGYSF